MIRGRTDGSSVVMSATTAAGPAAVWRALTDPAGTGAWLGRLEGRLERGRTVAVHHEEDVVSRHEVLACDAPVRLALTWDFPGEPRSLLTVTLAARADGGSDVVLRHDDLAEPVAYAAGWHRHLEFLLGHLAGHPLAPADFWSGHEGLVERYSR